MEGQWRDVGLNGEDMGIKWKKMFDLIVNNAEFK